MTLADACRAQLRERLGDPAPAVERDAYDAAAANVADTLSDLGLGGAITETLYAVLPALALEFADADGEGARAVRDFLAGWEVSDLPFYPIVPAIKTLEGKLFRRYQPNAPSLDLGIGDGYSSNFIFRPHTLTVGSEPLLNDILAARQFGRYRHLACVDATCIPFMDETFNSVYCVHAIDHVRERRDVLREVLRVLRPGGMFVFSDATVYAEGWYGIGDVFRAVGWDRKADEAFKHMVAYGGERTEFPYTPERYETELSAMGFEVVDARYFMGEKLSRLVFSHHGLIQALGLWNVPRLRGDQRLRDFYLSALPRILGGLIDQDEMLSEEGGFNLFVAARKPGELSEAPDPMTRLRCPVCHEQLDCGCGLTYPTVEGIRLLVPAYAEEWTARRESHAS
jgi:SAM-dependent methyltransferase